MSKVLPLKLLMGTLLPSMFLTVKSCAEPETGALDPPKNARVVVAPAASATVTPAARAARALRLFPKNGDELAVLARREETRQVAPTPARTGVAAICAIMCL